MYLFNLKYNSLNEFFIHIWQSYVSKHKTFRRIDGCILPLKALYSTCLFACFLCVSSILCENFILSICQRLLHQLLSFVRFAFFSFLGMGFRKLQSGRENFFPLLNYHTNRNLKFCLSEQQWHERW